MFIHYGATEANSKCWTAESIKIKIYHLVVTRSALSRLIATDRKRILTLLWKFLQGVSYIRASLRLFESKYLDLSNKSEFATTINRKSAAGLPRKPDKGRSPYSLQFDVAMITTRSCRAFLVVPKFTMAIQSCAPQQRLISLVTPAEGPNKKKCGKGAWF